MSGASSKACLRHHLGHVWGMSRTASWAFLGHVWGMSGASSGACLWHHLGHVWGIIWRHVWGSLRYPRFYMHLWCRFFAWFFCCWSYYDLCFCNLHLSTEQLEPSTDDKRPKVVEKFAHGADVQLIVEIFTPSHPEIEINLSQFNSQADSERVIIDVNIPLTLHPFE